jgi:hypothetical protein
MWYSGTIDMLCMIVPGKEIDCGNEDYEFAVVELKLIPFN